MVLLQTERNIDVFFMEKLSIRYEQPPATTSCGKRPQPWVWRGPIRPLMTPHVLVLSNQCMSSPQVSAPTTAGWLSPDEVTAALTSPPTLQDSLPSTDAASSSFAEPLPPSAVDLVVTLMRCNPCEVLGSLCRGIDTDGRIALIGRVGNGGASQASVVDTGGGRAGGKGGGANDGCAFRCSLEVAWDKDEGGVFVRRFSMERDEKKPRCVFSTHTCISLLNVFDNSHVFELCIRRRCVEHFPCTLTKCRIWLTLRRPPGNNNNRCHQYLKESFALVLVWPTHLHHSRKPAVASLYHAIFPHFALLYLCSCRKNGGVHITTSNATFTFQFHPPSSGGPKVLDCSTPGHPRGH